MQRQLTRMAAAPKRTSLGNRVAVASIAAVVVILFCLQCNDATVFCAASEVVSGPGASAQHAASSTINNRHVGEVTAEQQLSSPARRLGGRTGSRVELGVLPPRDPAAAPEQVHIALAVSDSRKEYAMAVAWATWPETQSTVVWGKSADEMSSTVEGSATSKTAVRDSAR